MKNFLPKTKYSPKGFTLVELMVVVAIIAILAAIGATVFGNVQKDARDAQRRSDIQAISAAIESRYVQGSGYVTSIGSGWFAGGAVPADPKGASYIWATALSSSGYRVCADLASVGTTEGASETDFCLQNQQ